MSSEMTKMVRYLGCNQSNAQQRVCVILHKYFAFSELWQQSHEYSQSGRYTPGSPSLVLFLAFFKASGSPRRKGRKLNVSKQIRSQRFGKG